MKTVDLIARLAAEAAPVRRAPSVSIRMAWWIGIAVLTLVPTVALVGPRPDLWARLVDPAFSGSIALIAGFTLASAWVALALSVPDDRRLAVLPVGPLLLVAVWGGWLVVSLGRGGPMLEGLLREPLHASCFWQILLTSALPAAALVRFVRQAAPLQPSWTGVLAAAAALGVGAVGTALVCPIDAAAHQVSFHFAPVAAMAALGIPLGKRWFDRLRPVARH